MSQDKIHRYLDHVGFNTKAEKPTELCVEATQCDSHEEDIPKT